MDTDAAVGAAIIDSTISNKQCPRVVVPIAHHRILVLSESPTLVNARSATGCVTHIGTYNVERRYVATEWAGGARTYWMDDIKCIAERIWAYVSDYGAVEAKSKEGITAALGVPHANCSVIVNALVQAGGLHEISPNMYRAVPLPEPKRKQLLEALATDEDVIRDFPWRSYHISYLCVYLYLSSEDARRVLWRRIKQDWGFWLAITGVVLASAGLVLQCFSWCFPK